MTTSGAITTTGDEYSGLTMLTSPAEAKLRMQELQAFMQGAMVNGVDYGVIPGTKKPSLFQPGAQKLAELYGFAPDYLDVEIVQNWETGFFLYRKKCVLTMRRDGRFIGNGVGSCNSKEDRYAWRWLDAKKVPKGIDVSSLKSKVTQYGTMYRFPNDDIFSLVNTIEKMACKRSMIHAVIGATRSAGLFTQDVEDLPADVFGTAETSRSWETGESPYKEGAAAEFEQALRDAKTVKALGDIGVNIKSSHSKSYISDDERKALGDVYKECAAKLAGEPAKAEKKAAAKKEPAKAPVPDAEFDDVAAEQAAAEEHFASQSREPGMEG